MSKQTRHQTVISRQSEEGQNDHWLREFESKLQKTSVQPRGQSVYDEIASIMNTKSKYPSVQAAVDDMMHRSGLSTYLDTVKESQEKIPNEKPTKTAQEKSLPRALIKVPKAERTLQNIIESSEGYMPISAIIRRLQAIHERDTADESVWEDDDLKKFINERKIEAQKNKPATFENFDNLGKGDHDSLDTDIDVSNTDAFNILMPAKI